MDQPSPNFFSKKFPAALRFAFHLHAGQVRKNKDTPYFAHLMSVAALVIEAGGDEEEAIAALLHDAVEDQGGLSRLKEIRETFGDRVAEIVDGCTDAYTSPKPPWRQRKEDYLDHLETSSSSVILVSLADKVHNARSIYRDLKKNGDASWDKFKGGKRGTLWYYDRLVDIFQSHETQYPYLVSEFIQLVNGIHKLTQEME